MVVLGIVASLIAGLATGVGAIPVLFTAKISDRLQGVPPGLCGGGDARRHLFFAADSQH